jgi:N-acetylglucosaminyl-diphospho-decaprenol L-rhamnosyltransferase
MVSVVIVNWNSGPLLERCVLSLRRHAPGCEIVLVDNDSKDTSLDFTDKIDLDLRVLRNRQNSGFAAACNQGWRAGRGDKILFLNPDAASLPGSVEALAGRIESAAGIWAVGGQLLDSDGKPQAGFNVRAFPTLGAAAAELLLLDEMWPGNPWTRRYRLADWNNDSAQDVDQPAAACLMVRRAELVTLGGFDEQFWPAWFEDVDLCKRIHDAGGRIVFEPKAQFIHQGGTSLHVLTKEEFLRFYHANQIRYFAKHLGARAAVRVRRLVVAGLRLRALIALLGAPLRGRASTVSARSCWKAARYFAAMREAKE